MKSKYITLSIALCSLLGVSSCDSYLDINPKQVLDQNILNKPSDIEGFVTAAYARMCEMGSLDSSPYMYWWSGSMRSDDCYKGGGGVADAVGSFGNISLFTYVNPNTGALDGTWYNSYQVIQRCNTAIQRMADFTEEELPNKNSFMGEMLFIRSFTLYRLKKLWKYVPYIDENVVGMSDAFEAVPNRELDKGNDLYLWQRILDDFKKAEELLPLDQMDKGRVSRNAATAMVARTILNMAYEQDDRHQVININKELLAEALPYIDKIIDQEGGRVGLESDFGNNFLVEYDNATKESIWELQFSLDNNFSTAGRLTYNYNEKYMFMASLRREGSSRFGDNHKWGWFPAISAGWRISKENFMQDIQWLDDLKVRIGYGVTGNEVTSNLLSMYLLNYGGYAYINGKWTQGAGPYQNPNPDLKWETKSELNLGLDFSFLKNRLSGSIDIYHRETSDLLSTYEVPTPPYIVSSMMANVGKIRNQGIELLLSGTPIKTRDLRFDITGTFSYNKNKIISLSNGLYQKDYWYEGATGSPIQTHTHIVREGDPVGNFHGFQTHSLTSDGLWMVYGADGQPKLLTDADDGDKKVIGNGIPTTYGSLNLALSYKGFDVSVMFRGAFNFQVLNRQRMHWETTSRIGEGNLPRSVLEKPFGSNSYVKGAPAMQSYYVEDGDYVKLDNISVGYTFNLKKQKVIQRLRLYVAGNNLLTMTGYKGLDPEVSIKGLAPGVEGSGAGELYPTTRQFTVGLNLLF